MFSIRNEHLKQYIYIESKRDRSVLLLQNNNMQQWVKFHLRHDILFVVILYCKIVIF